MKYVAPSAPLTVGGVLDNWLRLFRGSFAACWAIALIAAIAGALVQLSLTPQLPTRGVPAAQYYLQYFSSLSAPRVFLTDIALWLITMTVYGALLSQQAALVRGEDTYSFADALGKGLRRLPQMVLGVVLIALIIAAVCIPAGIAGIVMFALHRSPLGGLLLAVGITITVVLAIYVSLRLNLWMAVMFSENRDGAAALKRSWQLVENHWWRVTGIVFVSGIVIWILSVAVGAIAGVIVGFMSVRGTTPELLLHRIQLIGAVGAVVRLLSMPLLTAVWLAIYYDLKLRREGADLAERTEALSGN
jgi:hypothetical protein